MAAPAPPPTASAPRIPIGREQGGHRACGEAPAEAVGCPVARRLLVLLDDRDLPVVALGDDRRVEVVRGLDLVVERLHGFVVAHRLVHAGVRRGGDEKGVWLIGHGNLRVREPPHRKGGASTRHHPNWVRFAVPAAS